jgi:hypothetical protein
MVCSEVPTASGEFGDAVLEEPDKSGRMVVCDLNQPFLAATLGENGSPDAPTIFMPTENRFWTFARTKAFSSSNATRP